MRIGMVCPYSFDHPGGVQAHILDLAEVFISQGHEVAVLGPGTDPSEVPDYVTLGGGTVPLSYNGSVARIAFGPKTFRVVRDFLLAGDFGVLHLHEPNAPSYSLAALIVARGPVVATYHASAVSSTLLKLARPFLRPALEKIDAGISVSEMSRRWQVEQLGGDPLLIPNGVESARFRDAQRHSDSGPVSLVFLGRLDEPRKGLGIFLGAVVSLRAMVDCEFRVTVIGGRYPPRVSWRRLRRTGHRGGESADPRGGGHLCRTEHRWGVLRHRPRGSNGCRVCCCCQRH